MTHHTDAIDRLVGTGWRFPVRVDQRGGIAVASREQEIEQAIHIILSTAPGERVMRPEFGCRIHDLLFAPINVSTMTAATHYVKDALARWEPRVEIQNVTVEPGHVKRVHQPDMFHYFPAFGSSNGSGSIKTNGSAPMGSNGSHAAAGEDVQLAVAWAESPRVAQAERIEPDPDAESLLLIHVTYRIRATHDERSLVYPFYTIPDEV